MGRAAREGRGWAGPGGCGAGMAALSRPSGAHKRAMCPPWTAWGGLGGLAPWLREPSLFFSQAGNRGSKRQSLIPSLPTASQHVGSMVRSRGPRWTIGNWSQGAFLTSKAQGTLALECLPPIKQWDAEAQRGVTCLRSHTAGTKLQGSWASLRASEGRRQLNPSTDAG